MFENGSLGIVFALLSLWRTDFSDPFAQGTATPAYAYSIGQTYEDRRKISQEFRLTHFTDRTFGPVQIIWDGSVTTKGGIYLGGGGRMEQAFSVGGLEGFVGMSALVGLWNQGNDVDLGFPVEFRTDIEVGFELWEDTRISLVSDHRSHARLSKLFDVDTFKNSGMESISLRLTRQF